MASYALNKDIEQKLLSLFSFDPFTANIVYKSFSLALCGLWAATAMANLGLGGTQSGPVCRYRYMVGWWCDDFQWPVCRWCGDGDYSSDYDDDFNAQELKVELFNLPQGLFIAWLSRMRERYPTPNTTQPNPTQPENRHYNILILMKVWVWGGNTEGQLGLGEEAPETVFTPNQLLLQDEVNNRPWFLSCSWLYSTLNVHCPMNTYIALKIDFNIKTRCHSSGIFCFPWLLSSPKQLSDTFPRFLGLLVAIIILLWWLCQVSSC